MFITLALVLAYIRWDKKKRRFGPYVKNILILLVFVYLYSIISKYLTNMFNFSILNFIPETIPFWLSGIIFYSIICAISIKGWKSIQSRKEFLDSDRN